MIDLYEGDISNGQENVPVCIEKDVSEDSLPDFQVYSCLFVLFIFIQNQILFDFFHAFAHVFKLALCCSFPLWPLDGSIDSR